VQGEVLSEELTVTLSDAEKRKLRLTAAVRGTSMRTVVRGLIQGLPEVVNNQGEGAGNGR
jgi:hypothetical protein